MMTRPDNTATPVDWKENPYIIGRPIYEPERFFGREKLFDFIADNLSQRAKVILLHGQRRIGKSSVLSQIPNFVRHENLVFVPFDLQDQGRLPLSRVLRNLATEIRDRLGLSQDKVSPPPLPALEQQPTIFAEHFLAQVYQALGGKDLVLLLDEFDVLSNPSGDAAVAHFFPYLQSIIPRQEKLFIIAVVGRRLDEISTLLSLFKGAPHQEIGWLDKPSAERLINKPVEDILAYTPDAIEAILELSSGHPYFTQLLCHALFAHARDEQATTLTRGHVESIVDNAIESGEAGLVWFRDGLPIPERVIFSAVAEVEHQLKQMRVEGPSGAETLWQRLTKAFTPQAPTSTKWSPGWGGQAAGAIWRLLKELGVVQTDALRQAEDNLIRWGFLREITRTDVLILQVYAYEITIGLVRRWLLKRHPLRRAVWELEQLDPAAHQTYGEAAAARQRGDSHTALKLYEQVLQANPNHLHALLEMAEVCVEVEEFSKAVELYPRAYCLDPIRTKEGFIRALSSYGRDLMLQGKFDLAKEQFTKVLELEPDNPRAQKRLQEAEEGMRRALAVRNPFVVGNPVPPDQFVGRKQEVERILSIIMQHGHVAVYGGRGTGKTSLLHYVASPEVWRKHGLDPEQSFMVYVNCQGIVPFTPTAFWREVLNLLKEKTEMRSEQLMGSGHERRWVPSEHEAALQAELDKLLTKSVVETKDLRRLLQRIGRQKKFLVLLMDDYDAVLRLNEKYLETERRTFLSDFRNLATHDEVGRYLTTVVASSRSLNELGPQLPPGESFWYTSYSSLSLGSFNEDETQELLAKMPDVFKLSETELAWVRQAAGGYPYLLQAALSILFRFHGENKPFDETLARREIASIKELYSQ